MWLNFFDYRTHRENQTIIDQIHAKGAIETEVEEAVYNEMAKPAVKWKDETFQEIGKIPVTIDDDDIYYLYQFMKEDWARALSFKYSNWLAIVSQARDEGWLDPAKAGKMEAEGKTNPVQDWIFFPISRGKESDARVYFVNIGGAKPFHKITATPSDEHFQFTDSSQAARDEYMNSLSDEKGLYGYDLNHPTLTMKDDEQFEYGGDEESQKQRDLWYGQWRFGNGSYTGMSRQKASENIIKYLANNAYGWNTLSRPWSGESHTGPQTQELFNSLPK